MSLRREDEEGLRQLGYEVIKLPPIKALDGSVSMHADLAVFFLCGHIFVPEKYYEENRKILDRIISAGHLTPILTSSLPRSPYPHEVPLCALNLDNRAVLADLRHCASEICDFCRANGIHIESIRQGYAKCTSAYMGGLISSDPSALAAAQRLGIRYLEISPGGIELEGFDYGFIGGCSGFDGKKICFCGDIGTHPDGCRIQDFCNKCGVECVSLSNNPLSDIGSIFFV